MADAHSKVKVEVMASVYAGAWGSVAELDHASEHVAHLRRTSRRPAADAGFAFLSAVDSARQQENASLKLHGAGC